MFVFGLEFSVPSFPFVVQFGIRTGQQLGTSAYHVLRVPELLTVQAQHVRVSSDMTLAVEASVLQTMHFPFVEGNEIVVLIDGGGVLIQEPEVGADVVLVLLNAVIEVADSVFRVFNDYLHFF